MRILPRISLSAHALLLQVAGLALVIAAAAADLGNAGTVAAFVGGVTLTGLGLGAADQLPLTAVRSLDLVLVVAFAAGSVVCAIYDSAVASVILLAVAAGLMGLEAFTRWTRPAPR